METMRLKSRKPVEEEMENWDDDDDFLIEGDDPFRNASAVLNAPPSRRESLSSHMSMRSERESIYGGEEKVIHLPNEGENSTLYAIQVAAIAGVTIPRNVPLTALQGGTIKRLGGRKVKKILLDDWGEDLMLPEDDQGLHIKVQDPTKFPDVLLRRVSSTQQSPLLESMAAPPAQTLEGGLEKQPKSLGVPIDLERFRDMDEDDELFGDGTETIKVSKTRRSKKPPLPTFIAMAPEPHKQAENEYEQDLEIPTDGTLKLSSCRDIPKTPSSAPDDFDWGEGSIGTRFGGTRRDGRSNRSSSVSAFSPSIASSITAESEDEAQLDGIELPHGPIDLNERLRRQRQNRSPERPIAEEPRSCPKPILYPDAEKEDDFSGLSIGDGSVFEAGKLKLHVNVKRKDTRPISPVRPKIAVSLTFTSNKAAQSSLRPPRPTSCHLERSQNQTSLEPVSESGGLVVSRPARKPQSRPGHLSQSSQSSTASATTPVTSSAPALSSGPGPLTPQRRQIGQKSSTASLRNDPTTTNAQLLRLKRSLPVMKPPGSPVGALVNRGGFEHPHSKTDVAARLPSAMRPRTPVDRNRHSLGDSSATQLRKPFLPAGASATQSCNVNAKRQFRRHDSDMSLEMRPNSRAVSRSTVRSPSPIKRDRNLEKLARAGVRLPLSLPKRRKHFGDGCELDAFDDLPTSAKTEAEFIKQPKTSGPQLPTQFRSKAMQQLSPPGRTSSPAPSSPHTHAKLDYQPRFARDTASSRIARETNLAHRVPSSGPLAPLTSQRIAQLSARSNLHQPQAGVKPKRSTKRPAQLKPHLISNLNSTTDSKMVNGMFYNPDTYQWEGNDNVLSVFDLPASSPSTSSVPPFAVREKENAMPRPALITNFSITKGVQVVGSMVFDPQNMCWLKLGPQSAKSDMTDPPLEAFNALDDGDDDDVFKDIPDLDDATADTTDTGRMSEVKEDWLVGEEFDVGPEFIRRQREEEARWRKKCERWLGLGNRDREAWRWTIRGVVSQAQCQ